MELNKALVMAAVVVLMSASPTAGATDVRPDLQMRRLTDLTLAMTGGKRVLRFTTVIVNTGAGAFEVRGSRPDTTTRTMNTVSQRIYDATGGSRVVTTTARMIWGGDGHSHWHLRNLERYELFRLDNGQRVGVGAKAGFCFYDGTPYTSTTAVHYSGCGTRPAVAVTMGLSTGWSDVYPSTLPGNSIDVTGLPPGHYRLTVTADAITQFVESDEGNNATWVDIQLKKTGSSVKVLRYGPGL